MMFIKRIKVLHINKYILYFLNYAYCLLCLFKPFHALLFLFSVSGENANNGVLLLKRMLGLCRKDIRIEFSLEVMRLLLSRFSHVSLSATSWTVAHQVPSVHGISSKNTGVGCHFLHQGNFLTHRGTSNSHFLHCRCILNHWATKKLIRVPS